MTTNHNPSPQTQVRAQFLPTEDGEFNGNEHVDPVITALEEIKYLALTAGAPDYTPTPDALRRIIWLCRRAGVTKTLDQLGEYAQGRAALATEGQL